MPFGSRASPAPVVDSSMQEAKAFAAANDRLKDEAQIWWPRASFLTTRQDALGHEPCPAVIDVSGRARHLVFGPFQRLDPGRWRASLVVWVSAVAARRPLAVDFGAEANFVASSLPYGAQGVHRVELENTFGEADDAQLRVWLKRAAFDGEIGFLGVALNRVDTSSLARSEGVEAC